VTPAKLALYASALAPLATALCTGVAVKVDIKFNAPEERSERGLKLYNALPEVAQNVLANSEPWMEEP
jgi:hypothetical protein